MKDGSLDAWLNWGASTGPAAAATWAGTILSLLGFALTIWGILTAIKEAKLANAEAGRAKEQAFAANQNSKDAVQAVKNLKTSLSTSSLAYTHSQIGLLSNFVSERHYEPAHVLLATIGREMLHHAADAQINENTLSDLKRRLKFVSTHIGHAQTANSKFNPAKLRETVRTIQETIVEWEIPLRQQASEVSK